MIYFPQAADINDNECHSPVSTPSEDDRPFSVEENLLQLSPESSPEHALYSPKDSHKDSVYSPTESNKDSVPHSKHISLNKPTSDNTDIGSPDSACNVRSIDSGVLLQ